MTECTKPFGKCTQTTDWNYEFVSPLHLIRLLYKVCQYLGPGIRSRLVTPLRSWRHQPLLRFRQLWPQLSIEDGVLCHKYSSGPSRDVITVPVIPGSMQQEFLHQCHNNPAAGHQAVEKTLERLQGKDYWVSMNQHVERHCCECTNCQKFKLPQPTRAPLTSMPIGKPWQMVYSN